MFELPADLLKDPENGTITLADGSTRSADLIVASDGVHSRFTALVTGKNTDAEPTGTAAFRFLIDTKDVLADDATKRIYQGKEGFLKIYVAADRRLVWYSCRKYDNTILYENWRTSADGL